MWAELPDSVRDNFILYSMLSFKKHLKNHFTEISYVELELDSSFYCILSLQPASTLIRPTCRLGLWVGVLVWLGGWFLWFVGLGLVGLLHVEIGILWVYGGWNTFDIFFVQYCSMCYMCLSQWVGGVTPFG